MWKKSQASSPCAWVRRNARQEVSAFLGAGLRLYRFKTHRRVSDLRIHEISYAAR